MSFPESLKQDFDVLEGSPHDRILPCYRVRERKPFGREFMLRLLPDSFCSDKGLIDAFHEFFTRFSEISNKTYLAQVHSVVGAVNGPVYVLEEFVSGVTLKEFIGKRKGSKDLLQDAINIISRVCEALHYAHQKDIFHLSIAPEDILIDENNPGKIKLVGFGAQLFVESNRTDSLPTEVKKYLAPELRNGKSFGLRADVYSLAAIIKEAFPKTGNWDALISRSLSKTVSDRQASARAFSQELNDLLIKQTSVPTRQSVANNAGGLKPLLNVKTTPEGAQVSLNGASVGITTASGLRIPWKQGLAIEIVKPGFATETLNFAEPPDNSEITIKLKSAFRLFTNPWGASVLVDGKQIGVTDREGLMVPWDKGEIVIEKSRYKTKKLSFAAPPITQKLVVDLEPQPIPATRSFPEKPTQSSYLESEHPSANVPPSARFAESASPSQKSQPILWSRFRSADLLSGYRVGIMVAVFVIGGLVFVTILQSTVTPNQPRSQSQRPTITPTSQSNSSLDETLYGAILRGNVRQVKDLLANGIGVNCRFTNMRTPLIVAVENNHAGIVKALLEAGADPTMKEYHGYTATDYAKQRNNPEILYLLRNHK
jgi:serine/threonine protein kinase